MKGALFISSPPAQVVNVYSKSGHLKGQITGFGSPEGLAIDGSGNLYVADNADNVVDVFPPGATSPSKVLNNAGYSPVDVAVGADGTVYASDVTNGTPGRISVWAGTTKPSAYITDPNVFNFEGVTLDANDNLYAAWYSNGSGGVDKVKAGKTKPKSLGLLDVHVPLGIKLDKQSDIVLADAGDAAIKVFQHNRTTPFRTITGFSQPTELAFDASESLLFVTDAQANDAVVLKYKTGSVKYTVTAGLGGSKYPWGIALNPAAPL